MLEALEEVDEDEYTDDDMNEDLSDVESNSFIALLKTEDHQGNEFIAQQIVEDIINDIHATQHIDLNELSSDEDINSDLSAVTDPLCGDDDDDVLIQSDLILVENEKACPRDETVLSRPESRDSSTLSSNDEGVAFYTDEDELDELEDQLDEDISDDSVIEVLRKIELARLSIGSSTA